MPHFGMDPIGIVEWRRTRRKIEHVPVGRKHVDALLAEVAAKCVAKALEITQLFLPIEHLTQPGNLLLIGRVCLCIRVIALVRPVRANTELGLCMHFLGPDLDLYVSPLRPDHGRVYGAVAILLRQGDVIVELVRNMTPQAMDDPKGRIAVLQLINQHPHRVDIVDLIEPHALRAHLPPDTVDVLRPTGNLRTDARLIKIEGQRADHLIHVLLAFLAALAEQGRDAFVGFGLQVAKRKVFEFPADLSDAEPVRERRVDVRDLSRNPFAALWRIGLRRPDDAGALSEFDERNADVIDECDEHLSHVLELVALLAQNLGHGSELERRYRRHAQNPLDESRHLVAEVQTNLIEPEAFLTHRPIENGRDQALLVAAQLGEDVDHLEAGRKGRGDDPVLTHPGAAAP